MLVLAIAGGVVWYWHPAWWQRLVEPVVESWQWLTGTDRIRVYRWRSRDGTVQLSTRPPGEGVDFEIIEVDPDANVLPGGPTADR